MLSYFCEVEPKQMWLFLNVLYFSSLTYRFSDYYFVCATGVQVASTMGILPFSLPGFVEQLILLLLHVLFAVAEINILLLYVIVQ